MKDSDLAFIISILKGEKSECCNIDWYAVVGFLELHKIVGMFYRKAKALDCKLPHKVDNILSRTLSNQKRRVEFFRRETEKISQYLIEEKTEHIFLKGSVLCALDETKQVYSDGERISNDIDILVKPDGLSAICKSLRELGFIQGKYDDEKGVIVPFSRMEILKRQMNRGETAPFIKPTDNPEIPFIEVDVNFSLGNEPAEHVDLISEMINSRKLYREKISLYGANEELFYLHLIMHQFKESRLYFMVKRNKDIDLYKLADLYYIWVKGLFDKTRFRQYAEKYGLKNEVGTVLGQVARVFGDKNLLKTAKEYGELPVEVYDYETKSTFRWNADEKNRLCFFEAQKFLREVE